MKTKVKEIVMKAVLGIVVVIALFYFILFLTR